MRRIHVLAAGVAIAAASARSLPAQQVFDLPGLERPASVAVSGGVLFVSTADREILAYGLTPPVLRGRCRAPGSGSNGPAPRLVALPGGALAHDFRTSVRVDTAGACSGAIAYADFPWFRPNMEVQLIPVGGNYLRASVDHEMRRYYVDLLSSRFEQLGRLYDGAWDWAPASRQGTTIRLSVLTPYIDVRVDRDRIYVADTHRGFHVAVFDADGRPVRAIDRTAELAGAPLTDGDRQRLDAAARRTMEGRLPPGMQLEFAFPERFPAMHSFHVEGGRLYVTTYRERDGLHEVLVLDESGRTQHQLYLPLPSATFGLRSSLPVELNTVRDGSLYELVRNAASGRWELHITKLM